MAALEHVTEITVQKTVKSGPQKGTIQPAKERQISKADIFSKRTIFPFHAPAHADSVEDAIKISRIYKNKIDLPYIASLLGMNTEQARKALLETVEVFENPESGLLEPGTCICPVTCGKSCIAPKQRRKKTQPIPTTWPPCVKYSRSGSASIPSM